jgi:SAM-dependent methyltransferase
VRANANRSIPFVFDSVADAYVSGRPDMPLEAVLAGAKAVGMPAGARVLEIGAGAGQLTDTLVEAGYEVVALEPGAALREHAAARARAATFRLETFEEFEPDSRFHAIFSANAFHWLDTATGYEKAADLANALVLIWNTPFIANPELRRRVQDEVMIPHGSTFPTEEEGVRQLVADDSAVGREEMGALGRFEEAWWHVFERKLEYTPQRFTDFIGSMGGVASSAERAEVLAELAPVLGTEPFEVTDLVYVVAARALAA